MGNCAGFCGGCGHCLKFSIVTSQIASVVDTSAVILVRRGRARTFADVVVAAAAEDWGRGDWLVERQWGGAIDLTALHQCLP